MENKETTIEMLSSYILYESIKDETDIYYYKIIKNFITW